MARTRIIPAFRAMFLTALSATPPIASAATAAPPIALTAPDPKPLDFFGTAVAATHDRIVTAYPARYPLLSGRVFSFVRVGRQWQPEWEWSQNFPSDASVRRSP